MNGKIVKVALGAALALALAVAGTTPAMANPDDVIRRGSCSGSTDWKLKLSPDDNGIEVEYEVDSNVNGQRWQVRIKDNGSGIFSRIPRDRRAERFVRGPCRVGGRCRHRWVPRAGREPGHGRGLHRHRLDLSQPSGSPGVRQEGTSCPLLFSFAVGRGSQDRCRDGGSGFS